MKICNINPNSFSARIRFAPRVQKAGVEAIQEPSRKAYVISGIKKAVLIITCFSAVISKLIKVRQSIKLPS